MTNEFKKITRPLRNGYIFFITIVLAVLIAIQFVWPTDIKTGIQP